jgi:hypothetical protein
MRKYVMAGLLAIVLSIFGATVSAAPNPSGTGPPNQSCQDLEASSGGGITPGNSANSPGSPFNEPGINSPNGGTGGQHYSPKSQYDVSCYQHSQH